MLLRDTHMTQELLKFDTKVSSFGTNLTIAKATKI
jgi:hypothetical protein